MRNEPVLTRRAIWQLENLHVRVVGRKPSARNPTFTTRGRFAEAARTRFTGRDLTVDTARGIACILLVGYHVVGDGNTGLGVSLEHPLGRFNSSLVYLRMPLFTILSGYVYAMRPFAGDWRRFLRGKASRLLIPLLVVGTLFAVVQWAVPGTNDALTADEWRTLHLQPVFHYWYLEALFWVFIVVMVLEIAALLDRLPVALGLLAGAGFLSATLTPTRWLGIGDALYLLPFFLFGLIAHRFRLQLARPAVAVAGAALAAASLAYCVAGVFGEVDPSPRTSIPALLAGCSVGFLLLRSGVRSVWIASIGLFSYTIYLFHAFATAAARIGLEAVGVDWLPLLVALGTLAGVVAPMVLDVVVRDQPVLRRALLGRRRAALS